MQIVQIVYLLNTTIGVPRNQYDFLFRLFYNENPRANYYENRKYIQQRSHALRGWFKFVARVCALQKIMRRGQKYVSLKCLGGPFFIPICKWGESSANLHRESKAEIATACGLLYGKMCLVQRNKWLLLIICKESERDESRTHSLDYLLCFMHKIKSPYI